MTINELIKTAHENAKANGWWDEERNTGELLMLIVSECGEALEAHRNGRIGRWQDCVLSMCAVGDTIALDGDLWMEDFKDIVKDGLADELADIVIRIADLCGGLGLSLRGSVYDENGTSGNVGDDLLSVVECITMFGIDKRTKGDYDPSWMETAIGFVSGIASDHSIDLVRHITLKMEYNKTRGKKHGKAY